MGVFLHALGYVFAAAGCIFVTLSLASGLLWLSEIIEEHSKSSKLVGLRTTYAIIIIHVFLWWFDHLPGSRIAFSIFCHLVYLTNFTPTWPLISLSSLSFVSSCILVLADHFVWFYYFSQRTQAHRQSVRTFGSAEWRPPSSNASKAESRVLTFLDISTFFGVCVWLIPLFLFLSLSANDNALPTHDEYPQTPSIIPPSEENTPKSASYFDRTHHDDHDHSNSNSNPNSNSISDHLSSLSTSTSSSAHPSTLFQRLATPILSFLPRSMNRRSANTRDPDGIIAPRPRSPATSRATSPMPSPAFGSFSQFSNANGGGLPSPRTPGLGPPPRSPTVRTASASSLSLSLSSSLSGPGQGQEVRVIGNGNGYAGKTPILSPPPLRRATTGGHDLLSTSSALSAPAASNAGGNGRISPSSPLRNGSTLSGRRRVTHNSNGSWENVGDDGTLDS